MPTDEQIAAYAEVAKALRDGRLTPAAGCNRCGFVGRLNAHHDHGYDLEHQLDIEWLCDTCHRRHHIRRGVQRKPPNPSLRMGRLHRMLEAEHAKWLLYQLKESKKG
jgi:hypothetical protein